MLKFILPVLFFSTAVLFSQSKDNNDKNVAQSVQAAVISKDSVTAIVNSKISFYEAQRKENNERISALEKELEERKKLNERLTAALLVSRELLETLIPADNK